MLRMVASPVVSDLRLEWHQHADSGAKPPPLQAPAALPSMHAGCRTVVYAFADNCTSCTLHAEINGVRVSTFVSTSEIAVVRGTLLHTLAARAIVRDWEEGCITDRAALDGANREARKQDMINLSVEYQVVTSGTSFVAVEERADGDDKDTPTPSVSKVRVCFMK
jgi:poly [ADP-ribose] polymerase